MRKSQTKSKMGPEADFGVHFDGENLHGASI